MRLHISYHACGDINTFNRHRLFAADPLAIIVYTNFNAKRR